MTTGTVREPWRQRQRQRDRHGSRQPPGQRPGGRQTPVWAKACLIAGSVVMVASGVVVVGTKLFGSYLGGAIPQESLLPGDRQAGKEITGAQNILLLGMDQRAGSSATIRTDSIIIAHVNEAHTTVTLVSVPRDSRVEVPAFPANGYNGGIQKLTEAFGIANELNGKGDPSPGRSPAWRPADDSDDQQRHPRRDQVRRCGVNQLRRIQQARIRARRRGYVH